MSGAARTLAVIGVLLAAVLAGCSRDAGTVARSDSDSVAAGAGEHERGGGEHGEAGEHGEHARGEHDRDEGGHHGEEGEESGEPLALNETCDQVRNGARLVLAYEPESNSFRGFVENTTDKTLEQVRVEVHLSNGKELGPTTPGDLAPGEKRDIELTAESKGFDQWTAHPEVGRGEHEGHEEHGEHDRDGGEHDHSR